MSTVTVCRPLSVSDTRGHEAMPAHIPARARMRVLARASRRACSSPQAGADVLERGREWHRHTDDARCDAGPR
jgi:hypothetical protein